MIYRRELSGYIQVEMPFRFKDKFKQHFVGSFLG